MHRRAAPLLAAMALLAGAGCMGSAAHSTTPLATGIGGRARQIGGPWPGRRPLANVRIHVLADGQTVGLVRTDEHGRFSLRLPPGTYRVELDGGQELDPGRVTVKATGTTHLSLTQSVK
ncbi:MAG: MSCRAMM family protein [Gaiellales bacterium]